MKVLTVTTLFPNNKMPNLGIFIAKRMRAFAQLGHEIEVIAPVPYFPKLGLEKIFPHWCQFSQIPKKEERLGLPVRHPSYFLTPKIGMSLYGIWIFLRLLPLVYRLRKTFDFDIIDAHYVYPDALSCILLGKIFHRPVVVSARGTDINAYYRLCIIKNWLSYILKSADANIAVSADLEKIMVDLGARPDTLRVIPNGIDSENFYFMPQKEARQKVGIPENQKVILAVGHLCLRKNFSLILEAMKLLTGREHLYIIGEGECRENLLKLAAQHALQDRLHLVGTLPNNALQPWYNAADLLCLTSLREGSPNVLYEATACGTPIVTVYLEGACTVLDTVEKGIVVGSYLPQDIASAIHKALWEKSYNRPWIAQEGQKRTWKVVASELEEVFEKVIEQRKGKKE